MALKRDSRSSQPKNTQADNDYFVITIAIIVTIAILKRAAVID